MHVGDTIALSLTPEYLHEVGLLPEVPKNDRTELNKQMQTALERLAFLPFGLLIDRWRWGVFSGEITPEDQPVATAKGAMCWTGNSGVAPARVQTKAAMSVALVNSAAVGQPNSNPITSAAV